MNKLLFIACAWLIAGVVWAGPTEDAQRYYEDALRRFDAKEYKAAAIQLKNALQLHSGNLPARILMARALLKQNDAVTAEKEIRLAQQMGADPALTLLPLAEALNKQNKYEAVVNEIPEFGLPYELQADLHFQRGNAFLGMGDLVKATDSFQAALRSRSNAVLPVVGLAMVALRQEKFDEAEGLMDQAVAIDPNNAEVWNTNGIIAYGQGDVTKAVEHYKKALEQSEFHYAARLSLATAYLDLHRYAEAADELRWLRDQTADDPQVRYLLSVALRNSGDPDGAKEALSQAATIINTIGFEALKRDPPRLLLGGLINYENRELESAYNFLNGYLRFKGDNPIALKLLGSTLLAMNKPEEAVRNLKYAVELVPDSVELLNLLGDAYLRLGNYMQALGAFQEAERLQPGQPDLLHKLGVSLLAVNKREAAVKELEVALKNNPNGSLTAMVLSAIHLSLGNLPRAQEISEALVQREPSNSNALNLLATVYRSKGELARAREWYQKALAVDPLFRPTRINLVQLDQQEGKTAEARQGLDLLLKDEPENLTVMLELAKLEQRQGDIDGAIRVLQKAHGIDRYALAPALLLIDLHIEKKDPLPAIKVAEELRAEYPENPMVVEALGKAQLAAGKSGEARVSFSRVVSLVGYDSETLFRVAQLQLRASAVDDARWTLTKTVEGDPEFLPGRLALIELQINTGRLKDAGNLIDTLQQELKEHPAVQILRGDLAMHQSQFQDAVSSYQGALEKTKSSIALIRLFRARQAAGDAALAEQELTVWVRNHPDDWSAKRLLAEVYQRAGRLELAKQYYEELYNDRRDDPTLLNNMAMVYDELGDPRSLQMALRAEELAPADSIIIDTLGWLLVKGGQTEKGLGYLRNAIARNSGSPEYHYHLAIALEELGRKDEAREALTRALRLSESFSGSDDARLRLELLRQAQRAN